MKDDQKTPSDASARPPRGPDPLSRRSRGRLLNALAAAAARGDIAASEALVRLSLTAEEARRVSAMAAKLALVQQGAGR
jgi:hypothetical protein